MRSLPMCLVGGLAVGIFESVVRANVDRNNQSIVELWLFVAALVLVLFWVRGKRDPAAFSLSARVKPIPERLRGLWYVRHLTKIGFGVLFGALALLPFFLDAAVPGVPLDRRADLRHGRPADLDADWAGPASSRSASSPSSGSAPGRWCMVTHDLDIPVPFDLFDLSLQLPWGVAVLVATAVGLGRRPARRPARAAGPRPVPRGHHPGLLGGRGQLAVRPGGVHRLGVRAPPRRSWSRR